MQAQRNSQHGKSSSVFTRRIFVHDKPTPKVQKPDQQRRSLQHVSRPRSNSKRIPIFEHKKLNETAEPTNMNTLYCGKVPLLARQSRNSFNLEQSHLDLSNTDRKLIEPGHKMSGLLSPAQFAFLGYKIKEKMSRRSVKENY